MGVIKRQGLKAGIWMYAGVVLGFINGVLLYPKLLGPEVYGFVQWLFPTASLIAIFASLGMRAGLIRFFPTYRDQGNGNNGILGFSLLIANLGLLIVLLVLFLGRDFFTEVLVNEKNRDYLIDYYWLLPLLIVLTALFEILTGYLTVLLRPSISLFLKDLVARLLTTFLIAAFYFSWISLSQFLLLLVAKQGVLLVAAYAYIRRMGEWHLRINRPAFSTIRLRELSAYNGYNLLTSIGNQIINRVDSIMIPMLIGFTANGVYSLFYFITTIIIMPYEAVRHIVTPLIAQAWKDDDQAQIADIYHRTARGAFALALLIYIGIVANLGNAVQLIGPAFAGGTSVAIWLGLGQLMHCLNGYNVTILILSDRYRWDLLVKILAVILNVLLNYLFISQWGITGAAIATISTIIISNLAYQWLIWYYFRLHPYSWSMPKLTVLAAVVYFVQSLVPELPPHYLVDLVVRSGAIALLYIGGVLAFNLVPEAREAVMKFINDRRGSQS